MLALRALDDAEARAAVRWLAAAASAPDAHAPDAHAAAALVTAGLADPPGTRLLDMYAPHVAHARAHAARVLAAIAAFDAGPAPADALDRALLGAVALWRGGLFFEVHEVLEPHWARAAGPAREALQGLIQVAVAYHHLTHGNPRGARKLLADGREKLAATGTALPRVDAAALLAATAPWMQALATRTAPPDVPVPPLALTREP